MKFKKTITTICAIAFFQSTFPMEMVNCGRLAITAYDNLIFQEVDKEAAFDYALEVLNNCYEGVYD